MSKRYSTNIRIVKKILGLLICLLLGSILIYPFLFSPNKRLNLTSNQIKSPERNKISNPKVLGRDNKDRSYEIRADWGEYAQDHVFNLSNVNGKLNIKNDIFDTISSIKAEIIQDKSLINFIGNVVYKTNDITANVEYLKLDYANSTIEAHNSILLTGKNFNLKADYLKSENGRHNFKSNIVLRVFR